MTNDVCDNNFCWETNEFELRATASNGDQQSPVWRCIGIERFDVVYVPSRCSSDRVHDLAPSEIAYIDVDVVETDGFPNPDDHWIDYITPPPGFLSHVVRVSNNTAGRRAFLLYLDPDGFGCTPGCTEWVELLFKW